MSSFPWKLFIEFFARNLMREINSMDGTKNGFLKKLTSRKFLASMTGMIIGVCGMFAMPDNTAALVAFIALEIASVLAYTISEGCVDAKSVESTIKVSKEVMELVSSLKENREANIDTANGVQSELLDKVQSKLDE